MRTDTWKTQTTTPRVFGLFLLLTILAGATPAEGAVIGVLNDGRPVEELSLLFQNSAARVALEGDGHTIVELNSGALSSMQVMESVDLLWLPLLTETESYTSQERTNLVLYVFNGGRIIWLGDWDLYNSSDDSFLTVFGLNKVAGSGVTGLSPAMTGHPVVSGPFGSVSTIGTNANYGHFASSAEVADVFVGDTVVGTVVGFMDESSGYTGAGRVAFIADATMFGQVLLQDDHLALLRNIMSWVEATASYTPAGTDVAVGPLQAACDACLDLDLVVSQVDVTGQSTASQIGSGICGYAGVPLAQMPAGFVGYGMQLDTTAVMGAGATVSITLSYDSATILSQGITDEAALQLYAWDADLQNATDITTNVDTVAKKITGLANEPGVFLFGAIVSQDDCNSNGVPDDCEIDATSSAPGGPFFCTIACDPDCNDTGLPDACDIDSGASVDCNSNGLPDECEGLVSVLPAVNPANAGSVTPSGVALYALCSLVPIEATPATGYCFSEWSVDAGAEPADTTASQTSVEADVDKTVTANFIEIITSPPDNVDVCQGQQAVFALQVHADLVAGAAYQWQRDGADLQDGGSLSGVATSQLTINPTVPGDAGAFTCVVTHACGSANSAAATLSVGEDAAIVTDPVDILACPDDTVAFSVSASGNDLTYRWQYAALGTFGDLIDVAGVSGSGTATLQLTGIVAGSAGQYRCVVTGSCGPAVTSGAATLSVGEGPTIVSEPAAMSKCPGETVTLQVEATGTNLTYQWWFDSGSGPSNLSDDALISGATTETLVIQGLQSTHSGTYSCVVSGTCPVPVQSTPVMLTVGEIIQVLTGPADQSKCLGETAILTVGATGSGLAYQWQFDDQSGGGFVALSDGVDVSGSTGSTLVMQNLTGGNVGMYRCVVSGDCGVETATAPVSISILATIGIEAGGDPVSQSVCSGADASFQVTAQGANPVYQWQFDGGSAFENLADGGGISGAATHQLTIIGSDASNVGSYRCVVLGSCGPAVTSNSADLEVATGSCDCNSNGVDDGMDISGGGSPDCNSNGMPDECEIDVGSGAPGGPFFCEDQCVADCNGNGIPDGCDIANSASSDCNGDGLPDECQMDGEDCNSDGILDVCQIEDNDCNGNGVPDECDPPYQADAGPDIMQCVGSVSLPLGGAVVASGSTAPYAYQWRILSGPQGESDLLLPTAERARFHATAPGDYVIELEVRDSSNPPCVTTDTLLVAVYEMTVEAGLERTMCSGGVSEQLSPTIVGGVAPLTYEWTIEDGSPSTDASQFTGDGQGSISPTFTPASPGDYVLRLTVTDANSPGCYLSDTLTMRARMLTIGVPDDFDMCISSQSEPLEVTLTSPSMPPYTYAWSIADGSPDTDPAQFGGAGPASANPTFSPAATGTYVLSVSVRDTSEPPCEVIGELQVGVAGLVVDAGQEIIQCVGSGGIRLAPTVQGGSGDLIHSWTIESGSPTVDPSQFSSPHSWDETPLFTPTAVGSYTLRLTVTDSGSPACEASDTLIVRATSMTVNAGADFVTRINETTNAVGALPLVGGGQPPFVYHWRIKVGPDRHESQLSRADEAHPLFTPTSVGTYALEVTVMDANGAGCAITDTVAVEVITAEQTLDVNVEGRVFMPLQIDEPHRAGEVRVAEGRPGNAVTGRIYDDGPSANLAGLIPTPSLSRRVFVESEMAPATYVMVVIMHYGADEVAGLDELDLKIQWFDGRVALWRPAAGGDVERGSFPARPTRFDVGRCGVDKTRQIVWAVVDFMGEFSIGISSGEVPPAGQPLPGVEVLPEAAPLCGMFGAAAMTPLAMVLLTHIGKRRRRRSRRMRM